MTIANRGKGTSGTYETTDFAVDDVVLYTYSYKLDGTSYEGIQSVSKAPEKITGNLSEVTLGKNATVGSTKYDFSNKIANVADTTMLKYDVDVILDNYGYAIDIQPTNTNTAYAVVLKIAATAGDFNKTAKAELLFTDGTTQVVTLTNKTGTTQVFDKDSTRDNRENYITGNDNGDIIRALDIVKYQVNNAGKYTLDRVAAANSDNTTLTNQTDALKQSSGYSTDAKTKASGTADYTKTTNGSYEFWANNKKYNANGKTLFVIATKSGTDTVYTVYKGIKNVPTLTTTATGVDSVVYCESNGLAKIVYIDATANSSLSASSVIFLKPSSTMTATDNSTLGKYYTYAEAIVDGEKVEDFKVAADSFANEAAARAGGMFGSVNYDKNNIATVGSPFTTTIANAAGAYKVTTGTGAHKNETVTLGSIAYTYTSDCDVWYLDVNGVLTKIAPTGITTDSNDEVYFNLNAGLEVTEIVVVEVANKAPSNVASITKIQVAADVTSAGYDSIKGALDNVIVVEDATDYDVSAEGVGTMTFKRALHATASTKDSDMDSYTPAAGSYELADGVALFAVTATSEDGSNTVVKYVGVKAVTMYTLTLKTNAANKAAMVSVDGAEAVMIDDTGVNNIKVANGSTIAVTEISGGTTVSTAVTDGTGTAWVAGTNTWTLRGMTSDPTVTLTIS